MKTKKPKILLTLEYGEDWSRVLKHFLEKDVSNIKFRTKKRKDDAPGYKFYLYFYDRDQLYLFGFRWGRELLIKQQNEG